MWQNKLNGILGLWVIALAFLGFSVSMHRVLLVITGLLIATVAFLGRFIIKPAKDFAASSLEEQKKGNNERFDPFQKPEQKEPAVDIKPRQF